MWDSPAYGQRAWNIATDEVTRIGTGATLLASLENDLWITLGDKGDGTVANRPAVVCGRARTPRTDLSRGRRRGDGS